MRVRTPLQRILYWLSVTAIWGMIFVVTLMFVLAIGLPDTSKLYSTTAQPTVSYLDRSGIQLAVRGSRYAPPVDIDKLPKYVPDAFVAIEDQQFYRHFGFNPWGILRSQLYNISHAGKGGPLRGGSTITQQLARNLFLNKDQNYLRKIRELELAMVLEAKYSKKQILALYLNRMDFGSGAYGIEAASQRYFNTSADRLTLGQAALLAGMLKGPSRYSPIANKERAGRRAGVVLDAMVASHKITPAQRDAAKAQHVQVSPTLAGQNAQYFVDWIDAQVEQLVGKPVQNLIVQTTLDLPIQMAGENAVRWAVTTGKPRGVEQGALVALDGEGRIRAYVGGVSYVDSQYDRASLASRQMGSAFKPFVYLTAMEQGFTPYQSIVDQAYTFDNWTPKNFEGTYCNCSQTLQNALAHSVNSVAAKLADEVGRPNVAATATRLGVTSHIDLNPSMALGTVSVTPLQMAAAYSAFGNGGYSVRPYGIEKITTVQGTVLYDAAQHPADHRQVIDYPALQYMNLMLREVVSSGTGAGAKIAGYDLAGKTGTTTDSRDAWFTGYTGGFVATLWVGRDDNTPMRNVQGATYSVPAWKMFMSQALPRLAVAEIPGGPAPGPKKEGPLDAIGNLIGNITGLGRPPEPQAPIAAPPAQPAPVQPAPVAPAPVLAPKPPTPAPQPTSGTVIPY